MISISWSGPCLPTARAWHPLTVSTLRQGLFPFLYTCSCQTRADTLGWWKFNYNENSLVEKVLVCCTKRSEQESSSRTCSLSYKWVFQWKRCDHEAWSHLSSPYLHSLAFFFWGWAICSIAKEVVMQQKQKVMTAASSTWRDSIRLRKGSADDRMAAFLTAGRSKTSTVAKSVLLKRV